MRVSPIIAFGAMFLCLVAAEENGWAWGNKDETTPIKQEFEPEPSASGLVEQTAQLNTTQAEQIIDHILVSNRQGRNVDGFDEVYSDPSVQDALQKGDDAEARNLIKDRLCSLGLMQVNTSEYLFITFFNLKFSSAKKPLKANALIFLLKS